ncbi:hypothetical protein EV2_031311 [Malus domestica]
MILETKYRRTPIRTMTIERGMRTQSLMAVSSTRSVAIGPSQAVRAIRAKRESLGAFFLSPALPLLTDFETGMVLMMRKIFWEFGKRGIWKLILSQVEVPKTQ